jgi:hypothetical protein
MREFSPVKASIVLLFLAGIVSCGGQDGADNTESNAPPVDGTADTTNTATGGNNEMSMEEGGGTGNMGSMQGMSGRMGSEETVDDLGSPRMTDQGRFQVTITPDLDPVPINRIHGWRLHVETASGEPVEAAEITVEGGMPAHNHGMPTAPAVSGAPGNGDYLVEGVQFQMPGHWVVTLTINSNNVSDTVSYDLMLQP